MAVAMETPGWRLEAAAMRKEAQKLLQVAAQLEKSGKETLRLSMPMAESFTGDPEMIVNAVAGAFRSEVCRLKSPLRDAHTAMARGVAMYLMRKMTPFSYPVIGSYFMRDHSTVIIACRKVIARATREPGFAKTLANIEKAIVEA